MVIQNNIPAINSHRNLMINNSNLAQNLERLSSGFRINRAGDDAAGLAISERMRTQIRGLAMAEQNTTNGVNLIQTAEGGLNETHAILQRMRELAVMSSNATFQPSDREQIHLEVVALIDEIDRIASSTHYNRINLLDGTFGAVGTDRAALGVAGASVLGLSLADLTTGFTLGGPSETDAGVNTWAPGFSNELLGVTDLNARIIITRLEDMDGATAGTNAGLTVALQVGDQTFRGSFDAEIVIANGTNVAAGLNFRNNEGDIVASIAGLTAAGTNLQAGVISGVRINSTAPAGIPANNVLRQNAAGEFRNAAGTALLAGAELEAAQDRALQGLRFVERESRDNVLSFQIGANGGLDQRAALTVLNMSSAALGMRDINGTSWSIRDLGNSTTGAANAALGTIAVTESNSGVSILTQAGSNAAIAVIDAAIDSVSAQRAGLGALQNRLESTLNSLGVARENLTAAESTIRDVDMAAEMMRFTQNNILTQASQAMLAQANQIPQGVLQLLR